MAPVHSLKKSFRILWIGALVAAFVCYILYSEHLTAANIANWVSANSSYLLIIYCSICVVRGLALLPSTPFIFAGIILFPSNPSLLLAITLICILLSSTMIYYASDYMGFNEYFERSHPKSTSKIRNRLARPAGFYFITGWALMPVTPTDLMLYIASSIKLPFHKIIVPLMLGEAIICSVYIFNGVKLMEYFH